MRRAIIALCLGLAAVLIAPVTRAQGVQIPIAAGQPDLKVGDPAPEFTLPASDGKTYSPSKLRGKTVVLAWFPKAFTAG